MCVCFCAIRQEVSALHADFVRRKAEEEAYQAQQVGVGFSRFCSYFCHTNMSNWYKKYKPGI